MRVSLGLILVLCVLECAADEPPKKDAVKPNLKGKEPFALGPPVIAPIRAMRAAPVAWVGRAPTLADLVPAKIDVRGERPRLIMMIESYRSEKQRVKDTVMMREERQREVVVDGKTVTQNYTVIVPVTEDREIDRAVPAGPKPVTLEADDVRFFNLSGEEKTIDEVAKSHASLRPIFLLDRMKSDPVAMSDIARTAVREDFFVAVTEKPLRNGNTRTARFVPAAPAFQAIQLQPAIQRAK